MSHDDAQTTHPAPTGVSRRNFIKGVIAGGVAVSSAAYLFRNSPLVSGQAARAGGVERLLTLTVNGQSRRVDVAPQETLAMTLRYKLGLTGTKLGCDRAECGACTVLVDDVPRYSCSVLTHSVRARDDPDHRGPGRRRRHAAPGAAGRRRGAGLPVRVLHVGLHHGDGRLPEEAPESDARGAGARRLGQSLPLPGLRQDPHGARTAAPSSRGRWPVADTETRRSELHHAGSRRQGHRASRNTPRTSAPRACSSPSCC